MKSVKNSIMKSAVLSLGIAMLECVSGYAVDIGGGPSIRIYNDLAESSLTVTNIKSANSDNTNPDSENPSQFVDIKTGASPTYTLDDTTRRMAYNGSSMTLKRGDSKTFSYTVNFTSASHIDINYIDGGYSHMMYVDSAWTTVNGLRTFEIHVSEL